MDLDFQFEVLNGFELMMDTTVCQEETQEAIVPDASPDILRILDTRAQTFLTGKQVRDGIVTISGMVRACVFYQPESDSSVRHVDITLPFVCQAEHSSVSSQAKVLAYPRICWAEARVLNPRKVLLRVDLAVSVQAYHAKQYGICSEAVGEPTLSLHQLQKQEQVDLAISIQEKPFTFSDTLELGLSDGTQGTILGIYAVPCCSEYKLIGSKLIFKGTVEIEALVWDGAQIKCVRHSMAFSQIMEVSGAGEQCSPEVRVVLTDITFDQAERLTDGGEITLELLAQAVVHERRDLSYLTDLYSTAYQMDVTNEIQSLQRCVERSTRPVPVRELLETPTIVRTAVYAWADVGQVYVSRDGDHVSANAQVQVNVVYLDDAEQMQSIHHTFQINCKMDSTCVGRCQCWCPVPQELFVSPTAGGMEVRFTLEVNCLVMEELPINMVASASVGEARERGEGESPSMILRLAIPGESLWDIAKSYATTMEEIVQANDLEHGELPYGKMLLIPRTR